MIAERHKAFPASNRILQALPATERRRLAADSEAIELRSGDVVCAAGATIRHVYFPHGGVLTLFARAQASPVVGVGLIRVDGMFGLGTLAGRPTSAVLAVAQGAGHGDRIETRAFQRLLPACPALKDSLFAYADAVAAQLTRDTACVAFHLSRQRVARWMLDMTEAPTRAGFASTQAAIAQSLGLQRPAVSNVAVELQREGLIRYVRGEVTILDRRALREVACKCSIRWPTGTSAARRT